MDRFNRPSQTVFALSVGVVVAFIELSIMAIILHWPTIAIAGVFIFTAFFALVPTYWNYARHRSEAPAREWAERLAAECWNEAKRTPETPKP
jgi:hypothetical protein